MTSLELGGQCLSFAEPRIMGVLNITPDSFSDGGRFWVAGQVQIARVVAQAEAMVSEGADLLDVGGESTRPGAEPVSAELETARVLPVIDALRPLGVPLSIDTCKAEVAQHAVAAGCTLVNDVTGLRDPAMRELVARTNAAACIMHMRGEPRTMQNNPRYDDVVAEVRCFFADQVAACERAGIEGHRLLLDPGFGFGKSLQHNLTLLRHLGELRVADLPLLVGLSRKSMLGKLTGREVAQREVASAVSAALAVERGANILRVHDVAATRDAVALASAVATIGEDA